MKPELEFFTFQQNLKMTKSVAKISCVDLLLKKCVAMNLVEERDKTFLSPSDSQRFDELQKKMQFVEHKVSHYQRIKKRLSFRIMRLKQNRNLRSQLLKTIDSRIVRLLPDDTLSSVLLKHQDDVSAAVDEMNNMMSKTSKKVETCDMDISDTDQIVTDESDCEESCSTIKKNRCEIL